VSFRLHDEDCAPNAQRQVPGRPKTPSDNGVSRNEWLQPESLTVNEQISLSFKAQHKVPFSENH
jgi:hypothetical protein